MSEGFKTYAIIVLNGLFMLLVGFYCGYRYALS